MGRLKESAAGKLGIPGPALPPILSPSRQSLPSPPSDG